MVDDIFNEVEKKMNASLHVLQKEFNSVRTGRASISLLDGVMFEYYGQRTPLNQVATLAAPESRLLTIQPWDPSVLGEVERAILKSDLGLTPTNDGKIIRLQVPMLTEERRKQLVKHVKKLAEDCRVAMRNIRREGNDLLKGRENQKQMSEDMLHRSLERMQKLTDGKVSQVDEMLSNKEKEIMEV